MSNVQGNRPSSRFKDITDQTFNRLTAVQYHGKNRHKHSMWLCRCECGKETIVDVSCLITGKIKSCGCLKSESSARTGRRNATHGMANTPEWNSWAGMVKRCCCPTNKDYHNYGGRGIRVCDEWINSFEAFFAHVGPKPSPKHSIDRFPDVNGDYRPRNVRWSTAREQALNRRDTRRFLYEGEMLLLAEISDRTGLSYCILWKRLVLQGWSIERATTTDPRKYHHRKEP